MKDENRKWFLVSVVLLAILTTWIFGEFLAFLGNYFALSARPVIGPFVKPIFGIFPIYYTISVIINFLLVIFVIKRQDVALFASETIQEVKKVTWPTYPDTAKSTGVVLAVVFIFAFILWIYDSILTKLLGWLLG